MICALVLAVMPMVADGPIAVEVAHGEGGRWQLLRGGRPFVIRGAATTNGPLDLLAQRGGNSIRTWGADGIDAKLDEAARHGLTVTVGLWLGHERHGFNYGDPKQIARQRAAVRAVVERCRNHPAVLFWALGNEMEGFGRGDNPAIWSEVNHLAEMVKALDPKHPTMTVIAEIGGDRLKNVHRLCPAIDVVGINSYSGAPTLGERYRKGGGTKPWILAEYGPVGPWESPKTAWKAPVELSSTAKVDAYRRAYAATRRHRNLCLGSYAFLWGHKQETTGTWFGLFLDDGSRTDAVDVLAELWGSNRRINRCPRIRALDLDDADAEVPVGADVAVMLDAIDPEEDKLAVDWIVREEPGAYGQGGDAERPPAAVAGTIAGGSATGCRLLVPKKPGAYRLFVTVRDPSRGAAVANVPFRVVASAP